MFYRGWQARKFASKMKKERWTRETYEPPFFFMGPQTPALRAQTSLQG